MFPPLRRGRLCPRWRGRRARPTHAPPPAVSLPAHGRVLSATCGVISLDRSGVELRAHPPLLPASTARTCRSSQANCELAKMNSKLREEQRALRKEATAKEHQNKLLGNALKAAQAQLQELKSAAGLETAGALQARLHRKEAELDELDSKFQRLLRYATSQYGEKAELEEALDQAREKEQGLQWELDCSEDQLISYEEQFNKMRSKVEHAWEQIGDLEAAIGTHDERMTEPCPILPSPTRKGGEHTAPSAPLVAGGACGTVGQKGWPESPRGVTRVSPGSSESVGSPMNLEDRSFPPSSATGTPQYPRVTVRSAVAQALEDFSAEDGGLLAMPH